MLGSYRAGQARLEPFHLLAAFMAAYLIVGTIGPIRDIDAYWHVRLGTELLDRRSFSGPGSDWSFSVANDSWRSTQWIAELVLAQAHSWLGWNGVVVYRGVLTLALVSILAWSCLRAVPARVGAPIFAVAGVGCVIGIQDRPLLIGLCVMPFLAVAWARTTTSGAWPRWWLLLPATIVLANTHGTWILIPVTLGLAAAGRVLDHGPKDRPARKGAVLVVATLAAGAVSPLGVKNVTSILRFADAAHLNNEWQPTTIDFFPAWSLSALVVLCAIAWGRSASATPRSELLYVSALAVFGASAYRNVLPAILLLAAVVAHRVHQTWPAAVASTSPRERRVLAGAIAVLLGVSTVVSSLSWLNSPALPDDGSQPFGIAERIASQHRALRIFNEYNVAGTVLAFAGPQAKVGIDGRVDYYGGKFVQEYFDAGFAIPGAFATFEALDPDAALLNSSYTPLYESLLSRGWRVTDRDGDWVLLEPPAR